MTEVNFESEGRARSLRESITYSMDTQVNSYSTRPAYYFFSPEKMIKCWTRATKVDSNFIDYMKHLFLFAIIYNYQNGKGCNDGKRIKT